VAEPPAPRPTVDDDGLLTIACREFVELVTEHLEGTLPESVEQAIAAHLELCEPCRTYLAQTRSTVRALQTLPAPTLPPAARERLHRVYSALHEGTQDPPTG
jgi:predicted anti-sigma-YlaC factor YlaD